MYNSVVKGGFNWIAVKFSTVLEPPGASVRYWMTVRSHTTGGTLLDWPLKNNSNLATWNQSSSMGSFLRILAKPPTSASPLFPNPAPTPGSPTEIDILVTIRKDRRYGMQWYVEQELGQFIFAQTLLSDSGDLELTGPVPPNAPVDPAV